MTKRTLRTFCLLGMFALVLGACSVPPPSFHFPAKNQAPTAAFSWSGSSSNGFGVIFDGSASLDPDGTVVGWSWDFGDGVTGTGANPTHIYNATGNYTVTLTVTDDDGKTASTTETVNLFPPTASLYTYAGNGLSLNFSGGLSSDPDGSIVSWQWNFGDGTTGTGENIGHQFPDYGNYMVTLTVTDNAGLIDHSTQSVRLRAPR